MQQPSDKLKLILPDAREIVIPFPSVEACVESARRIVLHASSPAPFTHELSAGVSLMIVPSLVTAIDFYHDDRREPEEAHPQENPAMPVTSINDRDVEIKLNGEEVENLFDSNGEETFDLTDAVEANMSSGDIADIREGDTITLVVHV